MGEPGAPPESGETGPSGPGLTGEPGEPPRLRRSGGDGVSSPEDGGDGVPAAVWILVRFRTGGVFLWWRTGGGDTDWRLDMVGWGGGDGDGDIDSNDRPLRVRFL